MLDSFKWYRKLRGGVWYKIQIRQMISIDRVFWSRTHNGYNILKTENYEK